LYILVVGLILANDVKIIEVATVVNDRVTHDSKSYFDSTVEFA